MSGKEVILNKEKKLTRFGLFKKTKHTLKLRCADHGLSSVGKKADLVDRLFNFMHPPGSLLENAPEEEMVSSDEEGSNIATRGANRKKNSCQSDVLTLEAVRDVIQQELAAQGVLHGRHPPSMAEATTGDIAPLSPASVAAPSAIPVGFMPPPTSNVQPTQGLSHVVEFNKCQSLLPPVSEKVLNDIKNLHFIDLHALLPNALYDPIVNTENLSLEVNQSPNGASLLSLQPGKQQKRKINNPASWMEAWNIYM